MKREDQLKNNPQNRWQNLLASGDPRALARQCTARSKQKGRRCRNAARRGKTVCGFHGVARFDRITPEIAERRARRAMISAAATTAADAISQGLLHPETLTVFRETYAAKVPEHLQGIFLLKLDARLSGRLNAREWRETLGQICS